MYDHCRAGCTQELLPVVSKLATSVALKAGDAPAMGGYSMELVGAIEGMIDLERER